MTTQTGQEAHTAQRHWWKTGRAYPVRVKEAGYIQYIDPEYILTLAREKDLVIRLLRKPGDFVWREAVVALVWPAGSGR